MTGLVASGIVFILYALINLVIKKINSKYQLPNWKKVWQYCCFALVLPLFILLTFFGLPPMTITMSLVIILVLFVGLKLALYMGDYVVSNFKQSILTFFDGISFAPTLILIPLAITYGIRRESLFHLVVFPIVAIILGLIWLAIMTLIQKKLKRTFSTPKNIFLYALTIPYLLGSLLHYFISRQEHLYITNSGNFIADNFIWQILTFAIVLGMLWLVGLWRKNNDWQSLKNILIILFVTTISIYGVTFLEFGKYENIWSCENDQWVKVGEPKYLQPFPEECGVIDRAMMDLD
ncbi:hypothetical protein FWH30_01050 [Microgenomates group bacterium]|nr:hypothetical protein [Microgenomates group bacterium]